MALIDALAAWNPWWTQGEVPAALAGRSRPEVDAVLADLVGPHAVVLTGIRRSGKTTLMHQAIAALLKQGVHPHRLLYVNLEDLALDGIPLDQIAAAHRQAFAPAQPHYLFLDEVQTRGDWSRFARVLIDRKRDHLAVTGSTSSLLAGEPGRLLTGRHRTIQVRPLDFRGYLSFHDLPVPGAVTPPAEADTFVHHLDRFLATGGFPEPNLGDPATARRTLQHYFTDILQRDLVASRGLDGAKVRVLGGHIAKTFARPHTKRALQRATGISRDAIRDYLDALASAFVISPCTRFTWSPKPEAAEQAPVKFYLADPGLRNAVVSPGGDTGRLAENAVANALEAQGHALHYWRDHGHEVDFVVPEDGRIHAIQVTFGDDVPPREVAALETLWESLPASRRGRMLVLTRTPQELPVPSMPLWRWLT